MFICICTNNLEYKPTDRGEKWVHNMPDVPSRLQHSVTPPPPPQAKIRCGGREWDVAGDSPFGATCDSIATEMGIAGSFVISSNGQLMSKTLPSNFLENLEVELIKYDAGGF